MAEAEQRGAAAGTGRGARADIFREIGMSKLLNAEDIRLEAATRPAEFHKARKAAIEALKDKIQAYYAERERQYIALAYTNSDSKRLATLDADEYFKAEMKFIDERYPTQFMAPALSAIQSKNTEDARRFHHTYAATGSTYKRRGGYNHKKRVATKKRAHAKK